MKGTWEKGKSETDHVSPLSDAFFLIPSSLSKPGTILKAVFKFQLLPHFSIKGAADAQKYSSLAIVRIWNFLEVVRE